MRAEGLRAPAEVFDAYAVTGYFGGILGIEDRQGLVKSWLAESRAAALDAAGDLADEERRQFVAAHAFDLASAMAGRELADASVTGDPADTVQDLVTRVWPYHADVARRYGLDLVMYEGGSHVVGLGPQVDDAALTAFFHHFNYTPEMGDLYEKLLAGWRQVGGQLFVAYSDVYAPTKWGSWGALRHLSDENPRWDALVAAQ